MSKIKVFNADILKKTLVPIALSTTMSVFLSGCSSSNEKIISSFNQDGVVLEELDVPNGENIFTGDKFYKMTTYNVKAFDKYTSSRQIISFDSEREYNIICSPSEFGKYIGEENITWADIKDTLNNLNIDSKFKSMLLNGINNMEQKGFSVNLPVLNYNLKDLKIIVVNGQLDMHETAAAVFDPVTKTVTIEKSEMEKESFEHVFFHEVFGHGMTIAYISDKKIFCTNTIYTCLIKNDKYYGKYIMGKSLDESTADIISFYASNKKVDGADSGYAFLEYVFLMMLKSNNIKFSEYAGKGCKFLIDKMKQNGLSNQIDLITQLDLKLNNCVFSNSNINHTMNDLIYEYMRALADNYKTSGMADNDIIDNMNSVVDCYNSYLMPICCDRGLFFDIGNDSYYEYMFLDDLKRYNTEYVFHNKTK